MNDATGGDTRRRSRRVVAALSTVLATIAVPSTTDAADARGEHRPSHADAAEVNVEPGDDIAEVIAGVDSGATVRFAPGSYDVAETIVVETSVDLIGAGQDETKISSSAPGLAFAFIGPGDLTMTGLALRHRGERAASVFLAIEGSLALRNVEIGGGVATSGDAGHGIIFAFENLTDLPQRDPDERAGGLVVADSTVTGNDGAGILVTGTATPKITDTTISGNGRCGVCYLGVSGGKLAGATIEDNGDIAVQVLGSSHPRVERNTVRRHSVGVLVGESASAEVVGNAVEHSDIAIQLLGSARVDVRDNVIGAAEVAAVSLAESASGTLRGNHVDSQAPVAIEIAGEASALLLDNVIDGTGDVGISFIEAASGRAVSNAVFDRNIGFQVGGTAAPELVGNVVADSRLVGIVFAGEAAGSAVRNDVTQLVGTAIEVSGSSHPEIAANELRGSAFGIVYLDGATGTASDNRLVRHRVGVQLQGSAGPRLLDNRFELIVSAAMIYTESAAGEAAGNECGDGDAAVIAVVETAVPAVADNRCEIVEAG